MAAALFALLTWRAIVPRKDAGWPSPEIVAGLVIAAGLVFAWRQRRAAPRGPLARDPGLGILVAQLGFLGLTLLGHPFRLTSDGIDHFVTLRSLWMDRDLDFANDFARIAPGPSGAAVTPLGRAGNEHPVGPALVWSPFYLLADGLTRAYGRPADGDGPLYRNAAAFAGLFWGWLGLVALYQALRLRSSRGAALVACLGISLGTFLYWYLAYAPTMAHGPAFAAAALVLLLWLDPAPLTPRRAALLGAACGLTALLRWADVLIALLPLVTWAARLRRLSAWRTLLPPLLAFGAAAVAVFSPQLVVWKLLYGSWITIPQGRGFLSAEPAWSAVLFSPHHGLFSWSPLLYLGLAGLVAWAWREPLRGVAALAFALALARVTAGSVDVGGGAAFGARRFDALLPLFALGLAIVAEALARLAARRPLALAILVVTAFVAWNGLLARAYFSGAWEYSDPVTFEEMGKEAVENVDRAIGSPFSLPAALYERWRSGRALRDYESLFASRSFSRFSVRMGLDDRIYLDDGWSMTRSDGAHTYRTLAGPGAGLVVPLHGARPYRFGLRFRLEPPGAAAPRARLRLLVNERVIGGWALASEWRDEELPVPETALLPGRNRVRLRLVEPGEATAAVAGVWMEPER